MRILGHILCPISMYRPLAAAVSAHSYTLYKVTVSKIVLKEFDSKSHQCSNMMEIFFNQLPLLQQPPPPHATAEKPPQQYVFKCKEQDLRLAKIHQIIYITNYTNI